MHHQKHYQSTSFSLYSNINSFFIIVFLIEVPLTMTKALQGKSTFTRITPKQAMSSNLKLNLQ